MYSPKDFIPAKYKKNTNQVSDASSDISNKNDAETNSPWSDLAKEPTVPEYRSNITLDKNDSKTVSSNNTIKKESPLETKAKHGKNKNLIGLLAVFFLVIGVFSSYLLSKQNQDNRQQASSIVCHPTEDPYCDASTGQCQSGYYLVLGFCLTEHEYCGDHRHVIDGKCYHDTCKKLANGTIVCGYLTDGDPCTEESMGGDWCDNPNTTDKVESCGDAGLIRCLCGPEWWVIGKAASCDALCDNAGIDCSDCSTTPTPTNPPVNPPTGTPTPTPTPPSQPLACGEFNCTQNADCQNGLTCQSVTVDGEDKKICAKGENQLFCAANPTTANCCESQPMPICASIEMLDANNNLMETNDDDDLEIDDQVRFRCSAVGNQDVDFDYEFRIWDTNTTSWTNITDTSDTVAKNVSGLYTIENFGKYIVQGRICWGSDCQVWEAVDGAPTDFKLCYGENAEICSSGEVCSSTPAGGCPTITVNGITRESACASAPICRQAEGISCQDNDDCFDGYTCYQPPMPACPEGMSCTQVMPSKYCTK